MGADDLTGWLDAAGVPAAAVNVRTEHDRSWCLRPVPPGPDLGGDQGEEGADVAWEVFWMESGGRFEWTRFDDEDAACFYLFGRLAWAEALRGRRFA